MASHIAGGVASHIAGGVASHIACRGGVAGGVAGIVQRALQGCG